MQDCQVPSLKMQDVGDKRKNAKNYKGTCYFQYIPV